MKYRLSKNNNQPRFKKKTKIKYITNYVFEWILALLIAVAVVVVEVEQIGDRPLFRWSQEDNLDNEAMFREVLGGILLGVAVPLLLLTMSQVLVQNVLDFHVSMLGLLQSLTFTTASLVTFQHCISRGARQAEEGQFELLDVREAVGGISLAGITFTSLYLAAKSNMFRAYRVWFMWKSMPIILCVLATLGSNLILISTLRAWLLLAWTTGIGWGYLCYRTHFPRLDGKYKSKPLIVIHKEKEGDFDSDK
eukprot:gb/GECH01008924.1/.p1 GENE.gb/GECH01008924.1/~~gb/GECH01008924.1/.p1  ORF type:complete len:250 (+),score=19.51 gb/GECH01008924.1/:1-750(+)